MLRVALTGGMGSGKSYVARYFEALGIPVFYADAEAKALYDDPEIVKKIASLTHGKALKKKGEKEVISLPELAELIFQDASLRKEVENIIHPQVKSRFEQFCTLHDGKPYVLSEAALYFETGRWKDFDAVVLVTAPLELRLERLQKHRGISREEAIKRISVQWPDEKKLPWATYHIINDGERDVKEQVMSVHQALINQAKT
jgi:dephospho-CoA kinase